MKNFKFHAMNKLNKGLGTVIFKPVLNQYNLFNLEVQVLDTRFELTPASDVDKLRTIAEIIFRQVTKYNEVWLSVCPSYRVEFVQGMTQDIGEFTVDTVHESLTIQYADTMSIIMNLPEKMSANITQFVHMNNYVMNKKLEINHDLSKYFTMNTQGDDIETRIVVVNCDVVFSGTIDVENAIFINCNISFYKAQAVDITNIQFVNCTFSSFTNVRMTYSTIMNSKIHGKFINSSFYDTVSIYNYFENVTVPRNCEFFSLDKFHTNMFGDCELGINIHDSSLNSCYGILYDDSNKMVYVGNAIYDLNHFVNGNHQNNNNKINISISQYLSCKEILKLS